MRRTWRRRSSSSGRWTGSCRGADLGLVASRDHLAHALGRETRGVQKRGQRSEEHTSELQSRLHLVCRLLLEKKKTATDRMEQRDRYQDTDTHGLACAA